MAGERILVVDDEPGVRSALKAILTDEGFRVTCVASGEAGLEAIEEEPCEAVLLDVWLPGIDGLETLQRLRERQQETEVVMISGHATIETAVKATKLGAFDFVEKPLALEKTLLVLRNALRQRRLERANRQLLTQLVRDTEICGQSRAASRLRSEVEAAAGADAPVLIVGKQGSGRENVARRIHTTGDSPEAPFVVLPCGAIDAEAAVSALFGEQGRPGRLELAAGGSLYLEECDRLPAKVQERLAAALQAGEAPGLRLLASITSEKQRLNERLRRYLDVIRIEIPRLRERRDDIPVLAERCLRKYSREYGQEPKSLSSAAMAALQAYDWPGEVCELHSLLERLSLFPSTAELDVNHLPEQLGGAGRMGGNLYGDFPSLQAGLAIFTRHYIGRVMREVGGDRSAAAARLGLTQEALDQQLKDLLG